MPIWPRCNELGDTPVTAPATETGRPLQLLHFRFGYGLPVSGEDGSVRNHVTNDPSSLYRGEALVAQFSSQEYRRSTVGQREWSLCVWCKTFSFFESIFKPQASKLRSMHHLQIPTQARPASRPGNNPSATRWNVDVSAVARTCTSR